MATPWWKAGKAADEETFSDWQELKTDDGLSYYFNRVTQETTWDKPDEMMGEDEKASASLWCWIPDDVEVYLPGRKVQEMGAEVIVELENGEERTVKTKEILSMKQSSLQRIVADLTLLDEMSVPLILHCLRKRFEAGKIYSAIGTILISINPYTSLDLYTPKMIRKYRNSLEEHREVPPHVFVVADQAYKGLTFKDGLNQSIVISGESGAGKTEATKQCLSYLGAVAGSVAGVEKKVFDANPILEGFGNAKTLRNNNSSRFGKYVEIYMNDHLQLMGGKTTNYLLEKVRVASQQEGERNYHIFYMLTKGSDRTLRQSLELGQVENYTYCTGGNCVTVPGINDKGDFDDMREAFVTLDFSKADVDSLYRVVAGILHLGNCQFDVVKSAHADDTSRVSSPAPIASAAKMWSVKAATLEEGVTHKALLMPGGRSVMKGLDPKSASDQRDALCKFMYDKIFDWLVVQINMSMEARGRVYKSIGILDIFGFEIFPRNSLEQLCINFCNEKLQQLFNFTVFKQEEKVYETEAIGVAHVPFIDNQPILDMIEKKPTGIMPLLDEEAKTPGGSEEKYRKKLSGQHSRHKSFREFPRDQMCFVLSHYAGDVVYDIRGFMEKNKDELDQGLVNMLNVSEEHLIKVLFPASKTTMSARSRKATLSYQFRTQLNHLMTTLHATKPHYIRCIKPNEDKEPLFFVPRSCFDQMNYAGVFEAVKIRKGGFPFRLKHDQFAERYECILDEAGVSCGRGKAGCKAIITYLKLNTENIREGRTMMLYRAGEHKLMELKRNIIMEKRRMNETLEALIRTDPTSLDDPDLFYDRLATAVRACKRYNIKSALAEKARKLLQVYIESRIDPATKRLLDEAISEKNIDKLEQVCEIIEAEQYETERCLLALRMRDRIRTIIRESERAVVTLETNHMEACLFAADELGYTNDYIDYFKWMFETLGKDSDKFVQEQMRQAVKMGDLKRQIRLNIKLKDLFFAKMITMFAITNCPVLKELPDWAGEKFGFSKDKLKESFMVWIESEVIHTSFSTMDKKHKKEAKESFVLLKTYMQDIPPKSGTPDAAGIALLLKGQSQPDLRNELYLQLIKQLTSNPNPTSVNRGWNLMVLYLYVFPPSAELENYLEVFIRNQPADRRDRCLVALHAMIYSKNPGMKRPPTMDDVNQILSGTRPVRRDFLEEPPEMPSWAVLLRSFEAEDAEEYFEGEDLAGAVAPAPKAAAKKMKAATAAKIRGGVGGAGAAPQYGTRPGAPSVAGGPPPLPGSGGGGGGPGGPPTVPSGGGYVPKAGGGGAGAGAGAGGGPKKAGGTSAMAAAIAEKLASGGGPKGGPKTGGPKPAGGPKTGGPPKKPGGGGPPKKDEYVWLCHLDPESGDVFYENIKSGETTWDRPATGVKPYWLAHMDPDSGELYFENVDTGETAWDKPDEFTDEGEKWTAHKDDSGEFYYENLENGETTWDAPSCFQEKSGGAEWVKHFDPNSGDYYYENLKSGETTWDLPKGVKL